MKTGIVFEGGASRTIFSCGVMDAFIEQDIFQTMLLLIQLAQPMAFLTYQNKKDAILKLLLIMEMTSDI